MKTLCLVGNWRSDVGFAWKMIEQFWIEIAWRHPGRVILIFPQVHTVSAELMASGIEIIEFNLDLDDPDAAMRFVKKYDIGHLYLTDRPYASPTYRKLRSAGVQTITIHDHQPGTQNVPRGLKRFLKQLRVRWQGADAYVACADHVRQRHLNVVGAPAGRCFIARNGITGNPNTRQQSTIRAELGIPENAILVVSTSRCTAYKRIHDIITAATQVPAYFVHCGKGPDTEYVSKLESFIRVAELEHRFILLGDRSDVARILPACDIAVHASAGEGLSLAILEFMAAGLPTIVRNEPSVCECIQHMHTGLLFRDTQELVRHLGYLLLDKEERLRMGANARETVLRDYRFADTLASVTSIMRKVITSAT